MEIEGNDKERRPAVFRNRGGRLGGRTTVQGTMAPGPTRESFGDDGFRFVSDGEVWAMGSRRLHR